MPRHLDVLIAGQGLAGSLLAWHLVSRGLAVKVVDPGKADGTASHAAAGILNPFTGRGFQAPDHLEQLLQECDLTYRALEQQLQRPVFHAAPIWRLLNAPDQRDRAERRREQGPGQDRLQLMERDQTQDYLGEHTSAACMLGGGQVALTTLLVGLRQWLAERDSLLDGYLNAEELNLEPGQPVGWNGYRSRCVIFCNGAAACNDRWWGRLPWRRARGETIDIEPIDGHELPDAIIIAGKSLVSMGNGRFRLGATYDRGDTAGDPTVTARRELLAALSDLLAHPPPVRVVDAHTGVRPGSRPGPPFVGLHPLDDRVGILNGFGSRGTLLAPWYARRLAEHLIHGTPIPADSDVSQRPELQPT